MHVRPTPCTECRSVLCHSTWCTRGAAKAPDGPPVDGMVWAAAVKKSEIHSRAHAKRVASVGSSNDAQ